MALNECGLQAAESNRAVLRFIKEDNDCWGKTPDTGTSREMRVTKSSLAPTKTTTISAELRADRMVSSVVEVAAMSGGDVDAEFSAGSLDDFLEAFLLGTWTRPMTFDKFEGSIVAWTSNNTLTISGGDYSAYFTADRRIKVEGFNDPANNGYYQLVSSSPSGGNTALVVTTTSSVVEAGSSTSKVMDANDVIVMRSTAIRAGTAGANAFDSNGGNLFDTARDAGQLPVGMKVYVAGLGYEKGDVYFGTKEVGSIVFSGAVAENGDTVTIDDGVNAPVVFTFAASGNAAVGTAVNVATGGTPTESATNLRAAINANQVLNVTATGATTTVTVTNDNLSTGSLADSAITKSDVDDDYIVTDFAGGSLTGNPSDEDTVTISDGVKTVTFEFDNDNAFTRGNVGVTIGASGSLTAANLQVAIMQALWANKFQVKASVSGTVVTVTNIRTGGDGSIADAGVNVSSTDFSGGDEGVHGFFTVVSIDTAGDVLTVAEDVSTFANGGGLAVTVKGSHLRNPGDLEDIIAQSFTLEQGFADVSQYMRFTGQRVGSFSLSLSAGEIVQSSIKFMGKATTTSQASIIGSSPYVALGTTSTPVLNATVNVGNVYKNGVVLSSALQSIEITGEAALRNQMAVSSKFPAGIGTGRFNLTGKMTAYFETLELFDNFINHDTISLAFDFLDNDYNAYWFSVPALVITSDPVAPGGIDQDVLEEMDFSAFRDASLNTQFMVDRFSSILAV